MPWGFGDTQHIHFPEGQTNAVVTTTQNRAGISFLEFYRRVDAAIAALNQNDPLISMLTYQTTVDRRNYGGNSKKVWQRSAEYTPGRPQLGAGGGGYLLPIYHYETDLGFTRRGLMTMLLPDFEEELRTTVQAVANGKRADVLMRLFSPTEWPLDDDGNGASPGFAGSGTGTNAFFGILPNGQTADPSYTHYFQMADTNAGIEAGIKAMRDNLMLWHRPPFDLIGSQTALDKIMAIRGNPDQFVSSGSSLVRPATTQNEALVDPSVHLGVFADWVRVLPAEHQIDGDAFAVVKTYGSNSQDNPLAWRYDPLFGADAYVDELSLSPLAQAQVLQKYGLGAWNRAGAALGSIGGTPDVYAPPAIIRS